MQIDPDNLPTSDTVVLRSRPFLDGPPAATASCGTHGQREPPPRHGISSVVVVGEDVDGYSSTVLMPGVWSARVNSTNSASASMWALWPGLT